MKAMLANSLTKLLGIKSKESLLTSNMENLNDRVNFDLKNMDRIENFIIPNAKTLLYCHGWAANSVWFSNSASH